MEEVNKLKFFRMDNKELIIHLFSGKSTAIYKALTSLALRKLNVEFLEPLKTIAENASTMKNRKLAFKLIQNNFPELINQLSFSKYSKIGYVYFIKENLTHTIKIGRSHNLEDRLRIFISDLPFKIELLHYIRTDNYEQIELEFHKHYSSYRVNGEWFRLDEETVETIKKGFYPTKINELINS